VNKTLGLIILLAVGVCIGVTVATMNIAFEPSQCGEDCVNTAWRSLLLWVTIATLYFPIVGLVMWHRISATRIKFFLAILLLAAIFLAPAGLVFLFRLYG
jgi:hypothetical protein